MPVEQQERLRQFLASRSEIIAGDRMVLATLRAHARAISVAKPLPAKRSNIAYMSCGSGRPGACWNPQKPTSSLVFVVGQPGSDTSSFEQRLALSDALRAPFPREHVAVHYVAPNVLVLHEAVEGIEIRGLDRVISQSFGVHAPRAYRRAAGLGTHCNTDSR
jgi:hypothetical protein